MLTTAYGSPTCSDTMHVYAMTGALTQAATTFVDATAEAHSGCTRKTILDKRRHHSTSHMGTLVTTTTCVIDHTAFPATCIANMTTTTTPHVSLALMR